MKRERTFEIDLGGTRLLHIQGGSPERFVLVTTVLHWIYMCDINSKILYIIFGLKNTPTAECLYNIFKFFVTHKLYFLHNTV